ncbi:MAG: GNAT family N-acetyltransferase [Gammaproteobacteria bacterium]|nr:GNAT family N-acetyltransferase [Gammaproteobacteria bacterium]
MAEFNQYLAEETENKSLDALTVLSGVQALLDSPEQGRYYVADKQGELVGQLLLTYEWSDWRNGRFWWIQSVYVAPAHRRQGIFSSLYEHVEQLATQDPAVCGLRLYVEENNAGALETYKALGMSATGYHVLEIELD